MSTAAPRTRPSTAARRFPMLILLLAALALAAAAIAPAALADTGDIVAPSDPNDPQENSGWQAGTCNVEPPETPKYCSIKTPNQFFEQAGGHPQWGFTQIIVKHDETTKKPVGELKTVRVDLPVGLSVNPQATIKQCPQADFEANAVVLCAGAEVGESLVWGGALGSELGPLEATVYNIVPVEGEPARFGFNLGGNNVYLRANVAWESDYHEGFTIDVPALPFNKLPVIDELFGSLILKNRLVFNGRSGNGTFVTTPTTCLGPPTVAPFEHVYSTWLRADSYQVPDPNFPNGSSYFESPIPDFTSPKECDTIPFKPSLKVDPNTSNTDSPSGAIVTVEVPFEVPSPAENWLRKPNRPAPSSGPQRSACRRGWGSIRRLQTVWWPVRTRVRQGDDEPGPVPGCVEGRRGQRRDASVASELARGECLPWQAAEPRSRLGRRVPDLRRHRVGPVRHLRAPDRKHGSRPADRPAYDDFRRKPAGSVHLLQASVRQRRQAPLTSPPTCGPNVAGSQMIPWSGQTRR